MRDLAAEKFLVAVEGGDRRLGALAAQRHDIGGGQPEVRCHPHLGHGHHHPLEGGIVDFAALEDLGQRMAHQFADAKLALRETGRPALGGALHRPELLCFILSGAGCARRRPHRIERIALLSP